MRDPRRLQSKFESRKTTVSEMRWGTWALWHWSLMIDELSWNLLWSWDLTVNACIIDFTKPQIWAMVNQCAKTNMVPDCKPPAIAAKQRTTVGKVLWYCKYYKPSWKIKEVITTPIFHFSFCRRCWWQPTSVEWRENELVFHQNARFIEFSPS